MQHRSPFEARSLTSSPTILASAFVAILFLLTGCVRFQSRTLDPAKTADSLESRSLGTPDLKAFLEKNLHQDLSSWPLQRWNFEELTLAAFYYNPGLEVARADWRVAAGGIETAAERPNPTVTVSAIHEPVPDAPSPWIPSLVFDLPIETAGKRRLRTEQARHVSESARLGVAVAAWQVRSELRASLLDWVSSRERVRLLQNQLALREQMVNRLKNQLEAGAISTIQLNAARLELVRARADLTDAQRLEAEARPRLAAALGLPASALDGIEIEFPLAPNSLGAAEALTREEIRRLALLGRADILASLADYAASQSALQLEVAKQYPDIHLAPGYSWNAGSTGEHDWQIGATVELPILNRHRGPIAEAAARRDASAARFLALQTKVLNEIDAAIISFQAARTNLTALQALTDAQEAQQKSTEAQFKAGAADRLDVLASQLELSAADLARLDSETKLQQAVGALENAVERPFNLPAAVFETTRNETR